MAAQQWLVLITVLPAAEPSVRMRMLRTLDSLGAAVLREGVFLMPEAAANRDALARLADYVSRNHGSAHVLNVTVDSAEQDDSYRRLFDRSARYDTLVKTIESIKVGFGISDPSAISRIVQKQRSELELIGALDFFPSDARARAEKSLAEAESEVRKLLFPVQQKAEINPDDQLFGRTWATRKPLWADRLACAWLIRRFIDPEATLLWLDKQKFPPPKTLGFAYDGAHFVNSASRVTFEEMLARFKLEQNSALMKIGAIVHFLEVRDNAVPEAAGVETLLQGALRRAGSEMDLLREAEKTFDLLYEAYEEFAAR